jgi:uncharacterized protein (TIGR00725 family)
LKRKIITSFGSGFIKPAEPLYGEITELGKNIALAGFSVCSGGYYGSMEAISKGAKETGGKVTGITVKGRDSKPNKYIDDLIESENLMERILKLITIADAYIVFKGGTGTLLEISAALELMNKKAIPEKKMIFYGYHWKNVIDSLAPDSKELELLLKRDIKFINKPSDISEILTEIK